MEHITSLLTESRLTASCSFLSWFADFINLIIIVFRLSNITVYKNDIGLRLTLKLRLSGCCRLFSSAGLNQGWKSWGHGFDSYKTQWSTKAHREVLQVFGRLAQWVVLLACSHHRGSTPALSASSWGEGTVVSDVSRGLWENEPSTTKLLLSCLLPTDKKQDETRHVIFQSLFIINRFNITLAAENHSI